MIWKFCNLSLHLEIFIMEYFRILAIHFSSLFATVPSLIGYDYFSSINTLIGNSKNIFHWNSINSCFACVLVIKIYIKIIRNFSNLHLSVNDKCISFFYLYNKTKKTKRQEYRIKEKKANFQINILFTIVLHICSFFIWLFIFYIIFLIIHLTFFIIIWKYFNF